MAGAGREWPPEEKEASSRTPLIFFPVVPAEFRGGFGGADSP